jgi:hypothetical protein
MFVSLVFRLDVAARHVSGVEIFDATFMADGMAFATGNVSSTDPRVTASASMHVSVKTSLLNAGRKRLTVAVFGAQHSLS